MVYKPRDWQLVPAISAALCDDQYHCWLPSHATVEPAFVSCVLESSTLVAAEAPLPSLALPYKIEPSAYCWQQEQAQVHCCCS